MAPKKKTENDQADKPTAASTQEVHPAEGALGAVAAALSGNVESDPSSDVQGTTEKKKPVKIPKGSKPALGPAVRQILAAGHYSLIDVVPLHDGGKVFQVNVTCYPERVPAKGGPSKAEQLLKAGGLWWAEVQMMGTTAIIRNVRELPAPAEKKAADKGKEE